MITELNRHYERHRQLYEMTYNYYWVLNSGGLDHSDIRPTRITLPDLRRAVARVPDVLENGFPVRQDGKGNYLLVREHAYKDPVVARAVVTHYLNYLEPQAKAALSPDWLSKLIGEQSGITIGDLYWNTRTRQDRVIFFNQLRDDPQLRAVLAEHLKFAEMVVLNFPEGLPKGALKGTEWEPRWTIMSSEVSTEFNREYSPFL